MGGSVSRRAIVNGKEVSANFARHRWAYRRHGLKQSDMYDDFDVATKWAMIMWQLDKPAEAAADMKRFSRGIESIAAKAPFRGDEKFLDEIDFESDPLAPYLKTYYQIKHEKEARGRRGLTPQQHSHAM